MENFRLLVLFGLVSVFLQCIRGEMTMQKLLTVASQCKVAERATDLDLINLKMNVQPKTRSMKCLTACLLERAGRTTNGTRTSNGEVKNVGKSTKLPNKLKKSVNEMITECAGIKDPDRCEYASKMADCLINSAAKHGIKQKTAF